MHMGPRNISLTCFCYTSLHLADFICMYVSFLFLDVNCSKSFRSSATYLIRSWSFRSNTYLFRSWSFRSKGYRTRSFRTRRQYCPCAHLTPPLSSPRPGGATMKVVFLTLSDLSMWWGLLGCRLPFGAFITIARFIHTLSLRHFPGSLNLIFRLRGPSKQVGDVFKCI